MANFMKPIREELNRFKHSLEGDIDEFNDKLNLTRQNLSDYIDQQIEYLKNMKNDFNNELNYLEEENLKTCRDNQQEFDKLCLSINQNDHDPVTVSRLLERFKQTFPMRPKMLKSIPEYQFKDIPINDFITKQNVSQNSSSPVINKAIINKSSNNGFTPIDERRSLPLPTTSMGSSYHNQLALQNNESRSEPQSRLASTCTNTSEGDNVLDIVFRIGYEHNRIPHLMCYNEEENCFLMHAFSSHKFQLLNLNSNQLYPIHFSIDGSLLNLGYSTRYRIYYCSTRQTNHFMFFRLNEKEGEIQIEEEINLINSKDYFINVHIFENYIYFLYLTSPSIVMFGKYDIDNSSSLPSIRLENRLYENGEKSHYKIIDFTINETFICLLTQFKNNNKSKIIIRDYKTMNKVHSFDLIDAVKPRSIISTKKKFKSSETDMSDDDIELLLYINDPNYRLIHCCTYEEYLTKTRVNNFGICSSDDGNLVFLSQNDIRVLNVQDYARKNRE